MEIKSTEKFRLKESEESVEVEAGSDSVSAEEGPLKTDVDLPFFCEEYQTLEEIGRGGMGCVYKALEKATGKLFAIKTLNLDLANDAVALKRFEQEAEAASTLNHPNLVAVYGHGTTSAGAPYIVMDYLEGQSLSDVLAENKFLDPDRALAIFSQIADGLNYAHNNGVVHRDIKPTNVIITKTESGDVAKLVDFGISMVAPSAGRETRDLTKTGEVFGSPHYMSPEQCLGFMLDHRSDVYSFGCMMYESLAGRAPFEGANPVQLVVKHINEDPPPIPPELKGSSSVTKMERIIFRCLEKEQALRFQSVDELKKDLELVRAGKPIPKYARGTRLKPTLTKRQMLGALALVLVLCSPSFMLLPGAWIHGIGDILKTLICIGGIYAFLSAAYDKLRHLSKNTATHRQWLHIFFLIFIGCCGIFMLPYLVKGCFMSSFSYILRTTAIFFWSSILSACFAGLTVLSGLGYFLVRGSKKVRWQNTLALLLGLTMLIIGSLTFAIPQQSSRVIGYLAQSTISLYPEFSCKLYKLAISLSGEDNQEAGYAGELSFTQDRLGHTEEAIQTLTDSINKRKTASALERRAQLFLKTDKLDLAEKDVNDAIELSTAQNQNTFSPILYQTRALLETRKGNLAAALMHLDKSIEIDPSPHNSAYGNRIGVYCAFQQYEQALKEVDRMGKMRGKEVPARLTRGIIYQQLGRVFEAEQEYQKILEIQEKHQKSMEKYNVDYDYSYPSFYLMAAYAARQMNNDGVYKECLDKYAKRHPNDQMEKTLPAQLGLKYANLKLHW